MSDSNLHPVMQGVFAPHMAEVAPAAVCEDCPPLGYPTDKTRCLPCPRRSAWRPIESAPKDGTPIDVWGPDHGRWTDVYWGKTSHTCGEHGRYCDSDWHGQRPGWVDGTFNEIVGRTRPGFTHWMPLPAPPAAVADAEGRS